MIELINDEVVEISDAEIENLKSENKDLWEKLEEYQDLIDLQCKKIIKYCVPLVIKDLQEVSNSPNADLIKFMSDDYADLSFFEQLCFESRTGNIFDYMGIWDYMTDACKSVIDKLPKELNEPLYLNSDDFFDATAEFRSEVVVWLGKYTNDKLESYDEFY